MPLSIIEKKKAALADYLNSKNKGDIIPKYIQASHISLEKDSEEDGVWYVYPLTFQVLTEAEFLAADEGDFEVYALEHEFEGEAFYITY